MFCNLFSFFLPSPEGLGACVGCGLPFLAPWPTAAHHASSCSLGQTCFHAGRGAQAVAYGPWILTCSHAGLSACWPLLLQFSFSVLWSFVYPEETVSRLELAIMVPTSFPADEVRLTWSDGRHLGERTCCARCLEVAHFASHLMRSLY